MSDGMSDIESVNPLRPDKTPEREGLPPGYRMRADAHYVEQLTGRRADRVYADQTLPATARDGESAQAEPRERRDARERRGDRVLAQVTEEVAALEVASGLLAGPPSSATYRVGLDLVRLHAARAGWLVGARTLLDGLPRGAPTLRPVGTLLMQVREGLASECRLGGVTLQVRAEDWNAAVLVNERDVRIGVTGAILATMALVPEGEQAAIRVTVSVAGDELEAIEVAQDSAHVPPSVGHRFFDLSWTDRPGGWTAALGAAAARALAQRDGGSATFVTGERGGGTLRLTFRPSK